jgi:hypothetical protein
MMMQLPSGELRTNVATLAVPNDCLPAAARGMIESLPAEVYDPDFRGQSLRTVYFDTPDFVLRKARLKKRRYLTLRVRSYEPSGVYALSIKTEEEKLRKEIDARLAAGYLKEGIRPAMLTALLPADLLARAWEWIDDQVLIPVVTVACRRYAVEDDADRLTLDCDIRTDTGKIFPTNVMEHKTARAGSERREAAFDFLRYRPIKLSKFLWSTES